MNWIGHISWYSMIIYVANVGAIINKSAKDVFVLLKSILKYFFLFEFFFLFILIQLVIELRTWPLPPLPIATMNLWTGPYKDMLFWNKQFILRQFFNLISLVEANLNIRYFKLTECKIIHILLPVTKPLSFLLFVVIKLMKHCC